MIDAPDRQLRAEACRLDEFIAVVEVPTKAEDHPRATRIVEGVPAYDGDVLRTAIDDADEALPLRSELARTLLHGPGIVLILGAVPGDVVGRATGAFEAMIDEQRAGATVAGDHFAAPGANDRVWNALEKLALAEPDAFVDYYANDVIAIVATAWLGPAYQVTSQINRVNPGGKAQSPHRDYHLGFLSDDVAADFPAHVHRLSPLLTLQGAVAHCDMPLESGPTMYLPHSQKYEPGYVAWRRADFIEYFDQHGVQLPLGLGDAVSFNAALFCRAGPSRTPAVAPRATPA